MKKFLAVICAFILILSSVFSFGGCFSDAPAPCEHSFVSETTVQATCILDGASKSTCTKCGTCTYEIIAKLGHNYEDGKCTRCNKSEEDAPSSSACEHAFVDTVIQANSCQTGGAIKHECADCGYSYTILTQKTRHIYVNGVCSTCSCLEKDEANPCEHVYTLSVAKEATCFEEGVAVNTCSICTSFFLSAIEKTAHQYDGEGNCIVCEANMSENEACEHSFVQSVVNATCTAKGSISEVCANCGDRVDLIIDILPHRYLNGACSTCGALEDEEATPCEHEYFTTTNNATCVLEGSVVKICAKCNSVTTQILPLIAHDFVNGNCSACHLSEREFNPEPTPCVHEFHPSLIREATCLEKGLIANVCAYCSHTVYVDVDKLCHVYANSICVRCNGHESAHGEPCAHQYVDQTFEATCAQNGLIISTCSVCDSVKTQVIDKTAHAFSSAILTKRATCSEYGQSVQICSTCGQAKITTIEKLTHSFVNGQCSSCGQMEVTEECSHQYSTEVLTEATCLAEGSAKDVCLNCGDEVIKTIPRLNHIYVNGKCALCEGLENANPDACEHIFLAEIVDATCVKTGLITKTCTKCNSIVTVSLPKLEHAFVTTTIAPTCTSEGSTTLTCSSCGHEIVTVKEKLPHVYVGGACSTCGRADNSSDQHQYVSKVIRENTCEIYGVIINTCSICGDVNIATEQMLTHNFVDGVCSICGKRDTTSSIVADTQITLEDIVDTLKARVNSILDTNNALTVISNATINGVYVKNNALLFDFDYADFTLTFSHKINKAITASTIGSSDKILTFNIVKTSNNYQLNVIYADGTTETIGLFLDGGSVYISYLEVNDSNELIVNYSDGSNKKFGTFNSAPLSISEGLLSFAKIEGKEEYKVVGCVDKTARSIVIPKTHKGLPVTQIDSYAFFNSKVEAVTISENVRTIATWAFYNAHELLSIRISKTVTNIQNSAFLGCDSLLRVYYRGSEVQKDNIYVGTGNETLVGALWTCNAD